MNAMFLQLNKLMLAYLFFHNIMIHNIRRSSVSLVPYKTNGKSNCLINWSKQRKRVYKTCFVNILKTKVEIRIHWLLDFLLQVLHNTIFYF